MKADRIGFWQRVALRRYWLGWGAVVAAWFVIVYGGCNWLTSRRTERVRLHLDAELQIPLVPAAVVVYLSLSPLMWLSGWALVCPRQWRVLALTMMVAIGLAGLGFLALPAELGYEPWCESVPAAWHPLFEFTDALVGTHNLFPSLHVALAWICAAAYCRSEAGWLWSLWICWAAAITGATLLVHQHHLLDVAGGMLLAAGCVTMVLRRSWPTSTPTDPTARLPETSYRAPPA